MPSVVELSWAKALKVTKSLLSPQRTPSTQRSDGVELITPRCSAKRLGVLGGRFVLAKAHKVNKTLLSPQRTHSAQRRKGA